MRTPSIKFYLKPVKNTRYSHTVTLMIIYNRKKAEISTKMKCVPKSWDIKRERFKDNYIFNQRLAELESKVYVAHRQLEELNRNFTVADIKALIVEKKRAKISLGKFYDLYVQKRQKDNRISKNTKAKYRQTQVYLIRYLQTEENDLPIGEVDFHFVVRFNDWLSTVQYNENGDRMKEISVNKHHSRLKAALFDAVKQGVLAINPYVNFKLNFPQKNRDYLTQGEIDQLQKVDLSNHPTADNVRDIFLFSCYTGLRFQDAMNLTMDNITNISEQIVITLDQRKTGERREIPMLKPALEIIEKHSWSNDRMIHQRVLPRLSNPKVNSYLKFIAELAQIQKHLTHHVARHTFATTILLDNGCPLETVSYLLGHNSIRTTQVYAKISRANLKREMSRINEALSTAPQM